MKIKKNATTSKNEQSELLRVRGEQLCCGGTPPLVSIELVVNLAVSWKPVDAPSSTQVLCESKRRSISEKQVYKFSEK